MKYKLFLEKQDDLLSQDHVELHALFWEFIGILYCSLRHFEFSTVCLSTLFKSIIIGNLFADHHV